MKCKSRALLLHKTTGWDTEENVSLKLYFCTNPLGGTLKGMQV